MEFHARKLFEGQLQGKVVYRGVEGEGNMYVRLGRVAGRQAGKLGEYLLSQGMLTRSVSPLLSLTR